MTYRERREARADRLNTWADKREAKATAGFEQASATADVIPFGQPILVGHYSEGRDRRYRDRIGSKMDHALEDSRKADQMRSKAANITAAAASSIYSDDPDAIEALQAKITRLEAERARIKAYNASCRKAAKGDPASVVGDLSVLDDRQREQIVNAAKFGGAFFARKNGQFPPYHAANLSGTISAARSRLEALQEDSRAM